MAGAWFRREGGRLRRDDVVAAAAIQSWILNTSTVWPLRGPTGEGALFLAVLVADPFFPETEVLSENAAATLGFVPGLLLFNDTFPSPPILDFAPTVPTPLAIAFCSSTENKYDFLPAPAAFAAGVAPLVLAEGCCAVLDLPAVFTLPKGIRSWPAGEGTFALPNGIRS